MQMETMSDALNRLAAVGFADDLVADGSMLRAVGSGERHDPAELAVVETVRFEGTSDPDDEAVVFALINATGEPAGTFTMPYGPGAGPEESTIVTRLHQPPFRAEDVRAHQEHDHIVAVFASRAKAEAAVADLRDLGLGSEHLGVAVHGVGHVAFEHDAEADLGHDLEKDVGTGAVVGFVAGFALVGILVPVVGAVGVGGLLAIGAASGFGGAMLGGYIGVAGQERALTVHEQIARTSLEPGELLVAVCSHGHADATLEVLERHGGRISAQRPD